MGQNLKELGLLRELGRAEPSLASSTDVHFPLIKDADELDRAESQPAKSYEISNKLDTNLGPISTQFWSGLYLLQLRPRVCREEVDTQWRRLRTP